ncbi:MAG: hypothetical protein KA736_01700 [Crocinitomicaceae bacterium]|nr:hypothetical protein [Crocinitomicaceae bacterium]MBP6032637.1 hypothetical protein [Crocinitomicaceae bacterium]
MKKTIVLCFLIGLVSCKKEETAWNVDVEAPLLHDTLSLKNWVNDSTLTETNGEIEIDVTRTLLDIGLSELIKIPDTSVTQLFSPIITLNNIPPGTTFVNAIEEHSFDLDDIQLKSIRVKDGRVKVKVYNPLGTKVLFKVQMPGVTQNGVVFEQNYSVDAGSVANPTVKEEWLELSNYQIDLRGVSGLEFNILQTKLSLTTDPNGVPVSISSAYDFKFEASLTDIKVDYAKGYFGSKVFSDVADFNIDFLSKITEGTLDLPETALQISIENGIKVPVRGQLHYLKNTNQLGNTVSLTSPEIGPSFYISPAVGSWSSLQSNSQELTFDPVNSNLESFLENLGAANEASYEVQLNPWGNTSAGNDEAFPNSRIKVKASAQLPLKLGLDGLTLRDTFDINFKQNDAQTNVESGLIYIDVTNAFPFSCDPVLYLMTEEGQILHTLIGSSQISSCEMAVIDPIDGLKKQPSHIEFLLGKEQLADLAVLKKIIVEARFDSPNASTGISEPKQVQAKAFLSFKLRMKLNTKVIL